MAAILVADVVGYSRLMGADEEGTLERLKAIRRDMIDPRIAEHRGRMVRTKGDGLLVEFPSVVDAVRYAVEMQALMAERNADVPNDTQIVFRVGINLGDIIVDEDDIHGDGVNIAARLEAAADPGGVFISSTSYEHVRDKLPFVFEDLGEQDMKNIARPVRVYRVRADAGAAPLVTAPSTDVPLALPDKPSIAVLPFDNMCGDPEQEFFTDGISEDIITELSRFHSLFVIARNSSFSYKGKSPDIRQVGRELGVRYVLEGSIRKSSNRIRVTCQLIDTLSGSHIWAERYDRVLEDVFAVQEEVTKSIVAEIAPQITSAEQSKAARRRPNNLSAYEIALRAWAHQLEGRDKVDRALLDQSIREAREALAIDPGSVLALNALARANGSALFLQMASDRERALQDATWAVARAIELDGADPLGYALRGIGIMLSGRLDRYPDALADARRAHEMNPNDTFILRILGDLEAGLGEPERAIEHLHQVLRLNPRDPRSHTTHSTLAFASFGARQYAEGIHWASRAINDMPGMVQAYGNLVICLVGAGEIDRAKAAFEKGQGLGPEYFRIRLEGTSVFARAEDRKRQHTFLRIAAGLEDPSAADLLR